ncbi:glycosyltransferase [Merismopedia glauca]|uniref:Colanic acid biosynthesis glycosyltransferase WcaL n=1 Tax=Merismopedia glauca CCAP 1448/3 TaxID=1296344 RepID=A0A2T1C009_9CYAN|nr:glycosyltransferase [Merismopedia glauca]PSB01507.1 colanic acid biosynthesis glycosyltransferase WcaL [Merismopedia glauca CCAP 1448/3]
MTLKIAFIVDDFPSLSQTFVINQIVGLLDRGHQVDIYAETRGNTAKVHQAILDYHLLERTYYFTPIPNNLFWRSILGIGVLLNSFFKDPLITLRSLNFFKYGLLALSLRLLYTVVPSLNKSYDIIHCQFGTQSFRGMWFRQIHATEAKLITIFRGHDISVFVKERGDRVYDRLFNTGDFFLANCDYFRKKAIQLGCNEQKIIVYRSGLDCDRFIFKPRYFPVDGCIRLATTGRLVEKKGIEYAIRAVAKQAKITPNIEYNIIGDGELKEKLQQLIEKLNISNIVKILGWKNQRELIEILDRSHIFIAPSIAAKNGDRDAPINVLKEAMAMGLPVISTYHGGIPELVEDGVSGFLVPERDAETLAEKLSYLIDRPEQWEAMGKAGRAFVEAHYNLNKLNDELVKIYQQVLTKDTEKHRATLLEPVI